MNHYHEAQLAKKHRQAAGLTQKEVAAKINSNVQSISNWERGDAPIPFLRAKKICSLLKMQKTELTNAKIKDYELNILRKMDQAWGRGSND